jgi:hypothetical protein
VRKEGKKDSWNVCAYCVSCQLASVFLFNFCKRRKIEAAVQKRAQTAYIGKPMLAGLLFWLDRSMEQLLVDKVTFFYDNNFFIVNLI